MEETRVKRTFKDMWDKLATYTPSDEESEVIKKWWTTLRQKEPDFDALEANYKEAFGLLTWQSPFIAFLTIWSYGYCTAIDDLQEERIFPHGTRLPEWLTEMNLENLIDRFGHLH